MTQLRTLSVAQGGVLLAVGLFSGAANAALTGSGAHLAIPTTNPGTPSSQIRATAGLGTGPWTGSWSAPAASAWIGSFSVTGPIPTSAGPVGVSFYDFTSLPNGFLPTGTFFQFGDVDGGSATNETFTLQAFDSFGGIVMTPWLDQAIGVSGLGTGVSGAILTNNMPGWVYNPTADTYFIDGTTVTGGNPSINVYLQSNTDIAFLELTRTSTFASFALRAPLAVPAPGGAALLMMCGVASSVRRRRRDAPTARPMD